MKHSKDHLHLIKEALVGVVNDGRGTGRRALHPQVMVAGKTGTAQVITLEAEKRLEEDGEIPVQFRDHAWFVAAAPADNPQLALAVLIENAGQGGGRVAAPIAGELIKLYFRERPSLIALKEKEITEQ